MIHDDSSTRMLLRSIIRASSDFDAFCIDFFSDVYARFSSGMDRVERENQLLHLIPAEKIIAALKKRYAEQMERVERSESTGTPLGPPAVSTPIHSDLPMETPPPLSDPALEELRKAYRDKNLIAFVGAGLSAAAGLPLWRQLAELLRDHARDRTVSKDQLDEIQVLIDKERFIDALSALKSALGGGEFCKVIEMQLDDAGRQLPEVAKALAALGLATPGPTLRAVLTTNVDHLLERAFEGRWPALARATGDIAQRRHYILKVHGTLIDRGSWVFTREDYDRSMYADPQLQAAFSALFRTCPILFLGYGLADDDFDQVLAHVRALSGDHSPRHFALVDAKTMRPNRQRLLENAGLRLIPYPTGKHGQVIEVLRWLRS
ncbi:SIR2 family NAD-dependent protein deacylase [Corallococcus aberystwythensis]|uniref:Uncharacterized protein n=1 Tax=Corallococcus aberystwythensis TaxID=2316722 RepID=A0A3A8QSK3_9BACT|nr:SIR2 family protein [Corallococcus aberystwythensis]RKH70728.1 hypothetical protein D7W81_08790 [Corallococcus aberystwythensis]